MDEQLDPEMLEAIELLLNWEVLAREADWDVFAAIDNTPVKEPKPKRKPKEKADEKA